VIDDVEFRARIAKAVRGLQDEDREPLDEETKQPPATWSIGCLRAWHCLSVAERAEFL
jgi:hypothetical protein